MLHATRLTWPELQILYDVHGETRLCERELTHLEGYAASRPVRIGNDAVNQLQPDTYGEVIDAVFAYVQRGGTLDRATRRLLARLGQTVCRRWREPDESIREVHGGRRHHTYSKAMCWIALDRLLRLDASGHVRVPVHEFREAQKAIRAARVPAIGFLLHVMMGGCLRCCTPWRSRAGSEQPGGSVAALGSYIVLPFSSYSCPSSRVCTPAWRVSIAAPSRRGH
jgi:hypothetical protein